MCAYVLHSLVGNNYHYVIFFSRTLDDNRSERSVLVSLQLSGIYVADTNLGLQVSKPEKVWRKKASDYEHRYCGHCNSTTDIKEANFFGKYVKLKQTCIFSLL